MKKLLMALFVVAAGTTLSAQVNLTTTTKAESKKVVTSKESQQDKQIKDALMQDEDLQKQTITYLQKNKETVDAVRQVSKSTDGSQKAMMETILKDKKLSVIAIQYIKDNPDLLKKAMKMAGM